MQEIFIVFAGVLGATIGSFLSVLAERMPRGEDIVWRRSACLYCKKTLRPYELIPLVSFFIQRGVCRRCGTPIGWRYVFLEIATASLFAFSAFECSWMSECFFGLPVLFWWFFFAVLMLIAVIDFVHFVIPATVLSGTMLIAIFTRAVFASETFGMAGLGALIGGGFFWLIVTVSHERWMGMGDAELGALLGWVVGFPAVVFVLTLAALTGGLWGLGLLLLGRKQLGDALPFVPFLAFALVATIFMRPLLAYVAF